MEQETFVNTTYILYQWHPCYEVINLTYKLARYPSIQCILIYILHGIFSVVTVCGNGLVIISVGYFKQLHTPTNFLVLSLAVADVLVGFLVIPLTVYFNISLCVYDPHWMCLLRDYMDAVTSGSSMLHLCCISIDRYYAVCKPLTYYAKINNRVAAIMILACWSASSLAAITIVAGNFNHEKCERDCFTSYVIGIVTACIMLFYLPVVIMISIYFKIFLVAQKQARSIQKKKSGATASKMERKATKTLAIVLGVFMLCLCPYFVCIISQVLSGEILPLAVTDALLMLVFSNSMLNPFIYGFFYSWFRTAFKMIITGKIFQGDFTNTKLF